MDEDYSNRRSVHDSAMIAGWCFIAIVVLFAVMGAVQFCRWVLA